MNQSNDEEKVEIGQIYSKDAEAACIGSVIIAPEVLLLSDIKPEQFYIFQNRKIWEAIKLLHLRKVTPDYVTIISELDRMGALDEIGGPAYISSLISVVPSSLSFEHYASVVKDKAYRREVVRQCSELAKAAYTGENVSDHVARILRELSSSADSGNTIYRLGDILSDVYDLAAQRAQNPTDVWGMRTGFPMLDAYLGGVQQGESWYIAGQPAVGKSKFAHQIGIAMAMPEQGSNPGAIFSLEMRKTALGYRDLSLLSGVSTRSMKTGHLEEGAWDKITAGLDTGASLPVYVDDTPRLTPGQLRSRIARLKIEHDIKWVVLDYLLLMGGVKAKDETEKSAILSGETTAMAKEFDVAMITVNSVTKEAMDSSKAGMAMVRGSGQMIHDADLISFIVPDPNFKPKNGDPIERLLLSFMKFREGDRGLKSIDLTAAFGVPRFDETYSKRAGPSVDVNQVAQEWWNN